jgi:hypothetical protein
MTGWHVLVFHVDREGGEGNRLAVWQTDYNGLNWLDELVKAGNATVAGNGYPLDYRTTAGFIKGPILNGPPAARRRWQSEPSASFSENWTGRTIVDKRAVEDSDDSAPVLVRAWDES